MDHKTVNQYIMPLDQPVMSLNCVEAFNGLTDQEKLYTYHMSQASWLGGLIVTVQTSPEAPAIFCILHDMFKSAGIAGLKKLAVGECDFTDDEWTALVVYTAGFFTNMGNYRSYGNTKIIPGLPMDKLEALLKKAHFDGHKDGDVVLTKWEEIKDRMYSLSDRDKQLGLGDKGISTYFSFNCTLEDAELINRFMRKHNLEAFITRCFKTMEGGKTLYEIRSASVEDNAKIEPDVHTFEGCQIRLTKGDYSLILKRVTDNLEKAKEHASNQTEVEMLKCYINSFTTGSLEAHKNGSRFWIKDKGPIVETYIGFIETYRDPAGTRGEFRGFVSVVNRQMSQKFARLVEKAPELLPLLPWPREFETDKFTKPDFTSLDVVTFAGSTVPAGTNVPNYSEIRENEGFKNLNLGNVTQSGFKDRKFPFLSEEDVDYMIKFMDQSFEIQVGLHELLGHGSGKLLKKNKDGTTNYSADLINPVTKDLVENTYEHEDTFRTVFTTLGSAYEECRADCVGLLLCLENTVLKVFGHEGQTADDIWYVNWLSELYFGLKAIEMYRPTTETWMQAHNQGMFVILQVLIEAGDGLIRIEEKVGSDGRPDLLLTLDRTKINTVGRKALSDFMLKLQVFKSTADIKSARALFQKYSAVNNDGHYPWAKWRDIVIEKKKPRKICFQPNLSFNDGNIHLKNYEATPEGLLQSWMERFSDLTIYDDLEYLRKKDKPFFEF